MLAAIGNKAVSIHRVQTGPIELGDLPVRSGSQFFGLFEIDADDEVDD
jgi:16S rRNA U516 pseudouridylate synthase RsuA-like enzyme